jgi:transcription antitermination factor NusG
MPDAALNLATAGAHPKGNYTNTGAPEHSAKGAAWYILRCGAGLEFPARKALTDSGRAVFLPVELKWRSGFLRRKSTESEYPRFPGYVFARIVPPDWPDLTNWPLANLVRGILGMAGVPVPLAPGEIERLMADDGRPVPHDQSVPVHRAFVAGDQVRVMAGGWRDWVVRLDAIDEQGAHVALAILGRRAKAVLPLEWLEAA